MFETQKFPVQEKKMPPLKLPDALKKRVLEVLSREVPVTSADIDGYPDLSLFSYENLKASNYSLRVYGEIDFDGQRFFVGPKI